MTDRELLELAAKAAGIEGEWDGDEFKISVSFRNFYNYETWNPLTDDGDALRLAVKLEMDVSIISGDIVAWDRKHSACFEDCNDDPYAATRRAIVRVAAELGDLLE